MLCPYNTNVRIPHQLAIKPAGCFHVRQFTRQMLAASWGEPEVHCHVVIKKQNALRLTASVECTVNRI